MADPTHMREVVDRYLAAHTAGDLDGICTLFAPDAQVWDPVDQPPHVGADAVRSFFEGTHSLADSLVLTLGGPIRCAGPYAAFPMTARSTIGDLVMDVDIIDVFTFGDDGLVVDMKAYWNLADARTVEA